MVDVDRLSTSLPIVIDVLRESSDITIFNFRSILFLSMPEMKTKAAGWSLIKKLIPVAVATEKAEHEIFSEVGNVDLAMFTRSTLLKIFPTSLKESIARSTFPTSLNIYIHICIQK